MPFKLKNIAKADYQLFAKELKPFVRMGAFGEGDIYIISKGIPCFTTEFSELFDFSVLEKIREHDRKYLLKVNSQIALASISGSGKKKRLVSVDCGPFSHKLFEIFNFFDNMNSSVKENIEVSLLNILTLNRQILWLRTNDRRNVFIDVNQQDFQLASLFSDSENFILSLLREAEFKVRSEEKLFGSKTP